MLSFTFYLIVPQNIVSCYCIRNSDYNPAIFKCLNFDTIFEWRIRCYDETYLPHLQPNSQSIYFFGNSTYLRAKHNIGLFYLFFCFWLRFINWTTLFWFLQHIWVDPECQTSSAKSSCIMYIIHFTRIPEKRVLYLCFSIGPCAAEIFK